jgi:hypothetical protein
MERGSMRDSVVDNANQAGGVSAGEIYHYVIWLWRSKI